MMTRSFPDRESPQAYTAIEARGYKSNEIHILLTVTLN